jgi:hypothetical protein
VLADRPTKSFRCAATAARLQRRSSNTARGLSSSQASGSKSGSGPIQIGRLWVARRIDQARNVSRLAEHERLLAAEQLRRAVADLPRRQVVGQRAGGEHIDPDAADVDRLTEHGQAAGRDEWVVLEDVQKLAVQLAWQVVPSTLSSRAFREVAPND